MTAECWLPVVGFEGIYEVSDLGPVRSLDRTVERANQFCTFQRFYLGALLKQRYKNNRGVSYWRVNLWDNGQVRTAWVHTLVLESFVGFPPLDHECAHKDGDTRHNALINLAWKTSWENYQDRLRHGTQILKISSEGVRSIRAKLLEGIPQHILAAEYGVAQSTISKIKRSARRARA